MNSCVCSCLFPILVSIIGAVIVFGLAWLLSQLFPFYRQDRRKSVIVQNTNDFND